MGAELVGEWKKAGVLLSRMPTVFPELGRRKLYADAEKILHKLQEHIDQQDLPWVPLSESTVHQKGNDRVFVESGYLRENLSVRRLPTSKSGEIAVFVGASPWKKHKPSGLKFSTLMLYLEYGTETIPARPLMRPTMEEMRNELDQSWDLWLREALRMLL